MPIVNKLFVAWAERLQVLIDGLPMKIVGILNFNDFFIGSISEATERLVLFIFGLINFFNV